LSLVTKEICETLFFIKRTSLFSATKPYIPNVLERDAIQQSELNKVVFTESKIVAALLFSPHKVIEYIACLLETLRAEFNFEKNFLGLSTRSLKMSG
jgi:hypothetical protein